MTDAYEETRRQLNICNACRYCEGYCAVWDEMENMKIFSNTNIQHLANLCHDCRECYTVCPFTEPHEFNLNIPKMLSEIRYRTYEDYVKPSITKKFFKKQPLLWSLTVFITLITSFAIVYINMSGRLFTQVKITSMYLIVPTLEFKTFSYLLYAYVIIMWFYIGYSYYARIYVSRPIKRKGVVKALYDIVSHRYFRGGGAGCTYPNEQNRYYRLFFHPLVFFGFILDLISILFYNNFNVVTISAYLTGSIMMLIGSSALIFSDYIARNSKSTLKNDVFGYEFTFALFAIGLTGIMMYAFSGTDFFIILFIVHVAFVSSVLILAPYSKFLHPVFRVASLIKFESNTGS